MIDDNHAKKFQKQNTFCLEKLWLLFNPKTSNLISLTYFYDQLCNFIVVESISFSMDMFKITFLRLSVFTIKEGQELFLHILKTCNFMSYISINYI